MFFLHQLVDLNECESELSVCEINQICKNSFGSYKCLCQKGYKMTEGQCLDVDECSQHYSTCSHFCHNTPGSYMCSCPTGFYLQENRRNCLSTMIFFTNFLNLFCSFFSVCKYVWFLFRNV